jgi:GTP cyclohydrolase I
MHHPRHDQAAEYRRQAQEIRTMVQKLSIDEACEQLLETAERLEKLVEEEERKAHGLIRESRGITHKD